MSSKRWPERLSRWVEPLLTTVEAYPALERAALCAHARIGLWFRIFYPGTPLADPDLRASAGATWRDLIAFKLDSGVKVAVSDFDAAARPGLHAEAWRTEAALRPLTQKGLDLLVADHPARAGFLRRLPGGTAHRQTAPRDQLRRRVLDAR